MERRILAALAEDEAIPCLPQRGRQGRNTAQEGEEDHHEHEKQEQVPFRTRGGAFPCLCVAGAGQDSLLNTGTLVIDLEKKGWWVLCQGQHGDTESFKKKEIQGGRKPAGFTPGAERSRNQAAFLTHPCFKTGY